MDSTWLEGHEPARRQQAAHHYSGELDWTEISPTIDWAGGGLVTTAPNLARYVRALWSGQILDSSGLDELTRWTPAASFPPGHTLRYERYGLGMGANTVDGVELLGHTGFIGAFAFHAPACNAVLVGQPQRITRRPLAARHRALPGRPPDRIPRGRGHQVEVGEVGHRTGECAGQLPPRGSRWARTAARRAVAMTRPAAGVRRGAPGGSRPLLFSLAASSLPQIAGPVGRAG
jgi:Beta-lactamase